jgi:putative SOS response-associated peptidase YedK
MCGRYEIVDGKRILVRFRVANAAQAVLPNLDVRPIQQVPVLLADHELTLMKWGMVSAWAKDAAIGSRLINARAEGIVDKPSFKRPLCSQRCLLPASAFFEW